MTALDLAMTSDWSIRIDRLRSQLEATRLPASQMQRPVLLSVLAVGGYSTHAATVRHAARPLDHSTLLEHLRHFIPRLPRMQAVDSCVDPIAELVFEMDPRIYKVWISVLQPDLGNDVEAAGIERWVSRSERNARLAGLAVQSAARSSRLAASPAERNSFSNHRT